MHDLQVVVPGGCCEGAVSRVHHGKSGSFHHGNSLSASTTEALINRVWMNSLIERSRCCAGTWREESIICGKPIRSIEGGEREEHTSSKPLRSSTYNLSLVIGVFKLPWTRRKEAYSYCKIPEGDSYWDDATRPFMIRKPMEVY